MTNEEMKEIVRGEPLTVQELIDKLQAAIDSGEIEKDCPIAVCSTFNPFSEYFEMKKSWTRLAKYKGLTLLLY